MRKALTPPEARLWLALRPLRAQGYHFRRQHPFHGYFLDFVCLSRGLVIEVDGASHEHRADWDRRRDAALLAHGLRTLRIPAVDVRDHLTEVMEMIERGHTPRGEILVERVKPLRWAERDGYEAVYEGLNGAH